MIDSKLDWYPHVLHLERKTLAIRNSLVRCSKATWGISFHNLMILYNNAILPIISYAAEIWSIQTSRRTKLKLQQIQRSFLLFSTKAYRTVSNDALQVISGVMPIDLALLLRNDIKAITNGQVTNAVFTERHKIETSAKMGLIHPRDNNIRVDISGSLGEARVRLYSDGSKTIDHVGAGVIAEEDSKEIFIRAQRLHTECSVFQAELCGIRMAAEWIQNQQCKALSYSIHVDSRAALLAVANKQATHPLAVEIRNQIIALNKSTSITLHWVKGHAGLRGNERADYLAKTAASHKTTIEYDAIPISRGKQILRTYYNQIWNANYINSTKATHTKLFIPSITHRLSLSLWPNFPLTQFLTNHGRFKDYLFRMNKSPSPFCNCPEKKIQTAVHLLTECSLYSRERPAVLQSQPLPLVTKTFINTITVMQFLKYVFQNLQP